MAEKLKCLDIWSFWSNGWICIPTAPENDLDRFPSKLGRFLVSRFPGLEKNYNRLCTAGINGVSVFRSTETKSEPHKRILVYSDLRMPLSPGDYGIILTPDMPGIIGNQEEFAETEWERIEKTIQFIQDNIHLIPGTIYIPPLGFGTDGITEEDAVDELMALLIDTERIKIIYGIKTELEEQQVVDDNISKENKSQLSINEVETTKPTIGGSLIEDDFDVIEVRLPNKK